MFLWGEHPACHGTCPTGDDFRGSEELRHSSLGSEMRQSAPGALSDTEQNLDSVEMALALGKLQEKCCMEASWGRQNKPTYVESKRMELNDGCRKHVDVVRRGKSRNAAGGNLGSAAPALFASIKPRQTASPQCVILSLNSVQRRRRMCC